MAGPDCNESAVAERADGTLVLNMRSYRKGNRRLVSTSADGGETWTPPAADEALVEPVCQGSLVRAGDLFLFSNPASLKRENLTVKASRDGGRTWSAGSVLHPGPAAYSSLAPLADGQVGCLYERGDKSAYETITFARFPQSWIK